MLYGWKENSMLTNCLAAYADLTITVSEIQRDICEKIVILSYPLAFDAPVRGFPSEYRHPVWDGKTRTVSVPDCEKISISLFVLTWSTNVTDRHCMTAKTALASHRAVKTGAKLYSLVMDSITQGCYTVPTLNTHDLLDLSLAPSG